MDDSPIIGRGVRPDYDQDPIRRIVGIVGDVRSQGLSTNPRPEVYVPVAQVPDGVTILNVRLLPLTWVVRTATKPELLAPAIEDELKRVSGGLPVGRVRSMDSVVTESTARVRFYMWLMTMFGCCAVVLALVGVYSVAAYSVQQRTQEIGIRMSLGASRSGVRNMVLLEGISLGVVGVIIGDGAAFLLTKFLISFLYGVTPTDGTTFLSASVLLSGAVLVSMFLPARLATRVNPSVALRFE